jgi:hypothetical protein
MPASRPSPSPAGRRPGRSTSAQRQWDEGNRPESREASSSPESTQARKAVPPPPSESTTHAADRRSLDICVGTGADCRLIRSGSLTSCQTRGAVHRYRGKPEGRPVTRAVPPGCIAALGLGYCCCAIRVISVPPRVPQVIGSGCSGRPRLGWLAFRGRAGLCPVSACVFAGTGGNCLKLGSDQFPY